MLPEYYTVNVPSIYTGGKYFTHNGHQVEGPTYQRMIRRKLELSHAEVLALSGRLQDLEKEMMTLRALLFDQEANKVTDAEALDMIIHFISEQRGVKKEDLFYKPTKDSKGPEPVYECRQIIMYVASKVTNLSGKFISRVFDKDHTSVYAAIQTVAERMKYYQELRNEVIGYLSIDYRAMYLDCKDVLIGCKVYARINAVLEMKKRKNDYSQLIKPNLI